MAAKIDALLALRSDGRLLVGRDRIRLLEAVADHGSITKAAKAVGISYKTAWDAVNAINNLLPSPAFVAKAGGRDGGGAEVTDEGRRLIRTFHLLEERLARISTLIAEEGLGGQEDALSWTLGMRLSARNVFHAEVIKVQKGKVDVDITLKLSRDHHMHATVTNDACRDLHLVRGRKTLAFVKAPFVRLMAPAPAPDEQANWFVGTVSQRRDSARNSEVRVDIGGGKTLVAVVPRALLLRLKADIGDTVAATFDADHVILAAD